MNARGLDFLLLRWPGVRLGPRSHHIAFPSLGSCRQGHTAGTKRTNALRTLHTSSTNDEPRPTLGPSQRWGYVARARRKLLSVAAAEGKEAAITSASQLDTEILRLLLPAIAAVFLDPAMALVDTAIVGRLGLVPLGAVGLSNLVYFFATVFFSFLLLVTTPRVAEARAAHNTAKASLATAHNLAIAGALGVGLTGALWLGAPWLISRFGPESAVAAAAVGHLRVRAWACPAALLLFVQNGAFRGAKDTQTPLIAGLAQNAVNLSLDILLVLVLGVGVVGAAGAATVAQWVGAGVMLAMLLRRGVLHRADLGRLPPPAEVGDTLRPGVPFAFCIASIVAALLTATNLASGLGAVALAAHTIVKQIIDFTLAIFGTFSTVAQALVANCLGEGNREEARAYLGRLVRMGFGAGAAVAVAIYAARGALPALFSPDVAVVAAASSVLPIVAAVMPLAPLALSLEGTVLGASQITYVGARTTVAALGALGVLRFGAAHGWGLAGIWLGMVSLVLLNAIFDGWRLLSQASPLLPDKAHIR